MIKLGKYPQDVIERAVRTFMYGYLTNWVMNGLGYLSLFTLENAQYGVVAVAFSVAVSLGVKNIGGNESASALSAVGGAKTVKRKK